MSNVVREVIKWQCDNCKVRNLTAIPVPEFYEYECMFCHQKVSSVMREEEHEWLEEELNYDPGTLVLYVPPHLHHDAGHSSVEFGVVVAPARGEDFVFACYRRSDDAISLTPALTHKTHLYLYHWTDARYGPNFVKLWREQK